MAPMRAFRSCVPGGRELAAHPYEPERDTVRQRIGDVLNRVTPQRRVERHTGQSGHQLYPLESGLRCGLDTRIKQAAADTLPRGLWCDEKRSDPSRIESRVQQLLRTNRPLVTPVQRSAAAPPAAPDDDAAALDHEVGAIRYERGIHSEDMANRRLGFYFGVVASTEQPSRTGDQLSEFSHIFR